MSTSEIVKFTVTLGPTILFLLIVILSMLFGYRRGYHKSKVMLLHSLLIGGIFVAIYFILVNVQSVDNLVVTVANTFLGENGLQEMMGVSSKCTSLREILIEYIPSNMEYGDGLFLILKENGAYLGALVNLCYHLIFAIVLFLLYVVIKLIVSLFYCISYSEKRYRKKLNHKFITFKTDHGYKPGRFKGMLIGLGRGTILSVCILSLLGGTLYAVSGGVGNNDLEEVNFDDKNYDQYFDVYKAIDSYGTSGIFKVLNMAKDPKDVPYYLYLADLVFQGGFKENDLKTSIYLRDEIANFTSFSKESFKLIMNHGGEDIKRVIMGEVTDDNEMIDIIVSTMSNTSFQYEFTNLFSKFDNNSYAFNLALSLVDSVVSNIDKTSFSDSLDPDAIELIKILFKKDYKSSVIPYEQHMIEDKDKTVLPYIKPSNLIRKSDITLILNIILDSLNESNVEEEVFIRQVVNNIRGLSIMSNERKYEVNPVLARLFAFIESKYLTEMDPDIMNLSNELDKKEYHDFLYYSEVDWIGEINLLLDNVEGFNKLSNSLGNTEEDNMLDNLFKIFDETSPNYQETYGYYSDIKEYLISSKMIGKLLSTKLVTLSLEESLKSMMPNIVLANNIKFENTFDKNGHLIKKGELNNLLNILEYFMKKDNQDILNSLMNGDGLDFNTLDDLVNRLNDYIEGQKLKTYLIDSELLRSIVSASLTIDGSLLYVPDSCKEVDSDENPINLIKQDQYQDIIDNLPAIISLAEPLINDPENMDNIDNILNDYRLDKLLDNEIINATFSYNILDLIKTMDGIVLPTSLETVENWLLNDELSNLINSIRTLNIKISELETTEPTEILNNVRNLNKEEIVKLFKSDIIQYTISDAIQNTTSTGFNFIVPNSSLNDDSVITKESLVSLIDSLKIIDLDDLENMDVNRLLYKVVINKEQILKNDIISATIIANMVDSLKTTDLYIHEALLKDSTKEALQEFKQDNLWRNELGNLIDVLATFPRSNFEIDLEAGILDISNNIFTKYDQYYDFKHTYLDIYYSSIVVYGTVCSYIDQLITEINLSNDFKKLITDHNYLDFYNKQEIVSCLDFMKLFNGQDFNNIDFNVIKQLKDDVKFKSSIENSYLIRGIITNEVSNFFTDGGLSSHPNAFDVDDEVLKAMEIFTLCDFLGEFDLNSFDINYVNLDEFKKFIYDKGETKSYLLTATISNFMINYNTGIIIPSSYCDKSGYTYYIKPSEIVSLINSLETLFNKKNLYIYDIDFSNMSLNKLTTPGLIESGIINATITSMLQSSGDLLGLLTNDKTMTKFKSGFILDKDVKNKDILLFSEKEFNVFSKVITALVKNDNDLNFDFDLQSIVKLIETTDLTINDACTSSIIYIIVSDLFTEICNSNPLLGSLLDESHYELCEVYKVNDPSVSYSKKLIRYSRIIVIYSQIARIFM